MVAILKTIIMIRPSGKPIEIKESLLDYGLSQGWKEQVKQTQHKRSQKKSNKKNRKG